MRIFLLFLFFDFMFGWGNTGHRIVGKIAENHLSRTAKQKIKTLMGHHDIALLSYWADEIKSDPKWDHARDWHYATIPDDEEYVKGKHRGKVIEKVQEFSNVLLNQNIPKIKKQNAFKFLVHFIGDIHQPLHIGNGKDRGGNTVKVKWFNEPTKLHAVWDSKMIDGQNLSYTEYANFLMIGADSSMVSKWIKDDVLTYSHESRDYRNMCYDYEDGNLGYDYIFKNKPLLEKRLLQGGIRLAGTLNRIFK